MNIRKKYTPTLLAVTLVISAFTTTSESAIALQKSGNSLTIPRKEKINPDGPLSKLEIITAVKEKYIGEILSVRRKIVKGYSDCHHVRFISKQGDFIKIKVQCGE